MQPLPPCPLHLDHEHPGFFRQTSLAHFVFRSLIRFVLAPLALGIGGFYTTDFLLSGIHTWPRTSRIIALTLALVILSYEFVYKEHQSQHPNEIGSHHLKVVFYSCIIPYMVGSLALMILLGLSN